VQEIENRSIDKSEDNLVIITSIGITSEDDMNYLPGLVLSLLFALFIGFALHFWKAGGLLRLLTIEVLSVIGFVLGHFIAATQGINFLKVGWVNLGFGIIGSILFSFFALWLTNLNFEK
jgi:hypothetical protein